MRTWNIAHGVDVPPADRDYAHERRKHLPEMARMMVADAPDLILLQEVPVWAGPLLAEHTGMAVTMAPAYGAHVPFLHVPLPLAVGAALGNALPDLIRTQFEGQANALLYGPDLLLVSARRALLNERHRLRGEPRVAQLARLRHRRAGREFAVANIHADHGDNRQQMERAGFLLERFARGAPAILAGDFNAGPSSPSVRALEGRGWQRGPGRRPHRPHLRPRLRHRRAVHPVAGDPPRSEPKRRPSRAPVRPLARGCGALMLNRDQLPALAGVAYLNTGTNGPIPQASLDAMRRARVQRPGGADRDAVFRAVPRRARPGAGPRPPARWARRPRRSP